MHDEIQADRVLVAGATGHLGRHLVAELHERGCRVRVLIRRTEQATTLPLADEVFVGQVTDAATLAGAADGIDMVYSAVGITRQRDHVSYQQVDYDGNLALLREAERARVRHVTYIGILGGTGMRSVALVDAKERFADALTASHVGHTIVRPTGYFSDMREFLDMAERGRVYLVGDGRRHINPVSARDLAAACVQATTAGSAEIEVGGPQTFSYEQIARLALQAAGRPARITHLPPVLLRAAAGALWMLSPARYGPIQFFLAVVSRDMVAPACGHDRLADYFRHQHRRHAARSPAGS